MRHGAISDFSNRLAASHVHERYVHLLLAISAYGMTELIITYFKIIKLCLTI
jgi:hypothetical protein